MQKGHKQIWVLYTYSLAIACIILEATQETLRIVSFLECEVHYVSMDSAPLHGSVIKKMITRVMASLELTL